MDQEAFWELAERVRREFRIVTHSCRPRVEAARAAGADASFVEAPGSLDELRAIGRRAPAPNVANMIERGRTPYTVTLTSTASLADPWDRHSQKCP
jgi:2-methylisocitrate lyase-like PEP mutase family enzyme